ILQKLNHLIEELSTSDRFIKLFLASYNKDTAEFIYVNAGHNPPLHFSRKNQLAKLKKNSVCIGVVPFDYRIEKIHLEKNDILLMYTDGVLEAKNDLHEMFGEKNLVQAVLDKQNQNCEVIQDEITLRVLDHCGDRPLDDDYTLFIIKKN
ncbi:MAG: serine/threonine-protein phosphatase, partial [Calditrichaeota bacterium]|nr:serine/threonine-protein phosphatase [Calditrichota bacterium]